MPATIKPENSLSADCEGKRRGVYYLLPLDDGTETRLLSDHGRVYAYRVTERAER